MRPSLRLPVLVLGVVVSLAGATLTAGADHIPARHRNMDILFQQQNATGAVNSDLAFWGDLAFAGNYDGFRIFDISDPATPSLVSEVACAGPQNDISVWDTDGTGEADVLFLSIDRTLSGPECGAVPVAHDDPDGWEGIRIFDVSDPANPQQIGAVYQDCGSHTHTVYPDDDRNRLLILNSSYPLRPGPTCGSERGPEAGRDSLHGVVQVIGVPMDDPAAAREVAELPINYPGDPDNTYTWSEHGLVFPGMETEARACHDISVFLPKMLVAGACAEQAQLWRLDPDTMLPDTANPLWVFDDPVDENGATGEANDPHIAVDFWHSATFSWDGKIVNFSDESFAGFDPEAPQACPPVSRKLDAESGQLRQHADTGRTHFLQVSNGTRLSHFMIDRPEPEGYCSTHQGNAVATPGRNLLVQAWRQGGVNIIDFTAPRKPREIAFFDFLPAGPQGSDNWTVYWYERNPSAGTPFTAYGQDGRTAQGRGFEVFRSTAVTGERAGLDHLNPQTQEVLIR